MEWGRATTAPSGITSEGSELINLARECFPKTMGGRGVPRPANFGNTNSLPDLFNIIALWDRLSAFLAPVPIRTVMLNRLHERERNECPAGSAERGNE